MSIWREAETPSGASPGAALPGLMMAGQKVAGLYRQIRQSILKIENIDADNMEVRQVIDGKESQESITFWHTAEGAQTIRVKGYH